MTAPYNQSQPSTGYNEAEGHAAILVQQALWIEGSVDGTVQPSQRLDLSDVDTEELSSSAQFIMRQAAEIASLTARCEAMEKALKDIEFFTVDPSSKATARLVLHGLARSP